MARKRRQGLIRPLLLGSAAALALGALFVASYAERTLSQLVVGGLGESFSTRIYAEPFILREGPGPSPERLFKRLSRLHYAAVLQPPAHAGQYSWHPPALIVNLRGFSEPLMKQDPGVFALSWDGRQWTVTSSSGQPAGQLALEPELAAELSGPKMVRRDPAEAAEIPQHLKDAVVAAEDKRFYSHWGLDPRSALRALWADLRGRGALQGGSTITQQLSKNLFLSPKRNLKRKIIEAVLAVYLELRYSKEKILTLYLNHIYLGQDGPVSVAGVKAAAHFYFGRDLKDLSLAQCAALAGLIRSPHRYNPFHDPPASLERRNFVLKRMHEEGMISPAELQAAQKEPLGALAGKPAALGNKDDGYFVAEVVRQLTPRYGEDALFRNGLSVYTTMDPLLQSAAQRVVSRARPQGALIALDAATGKVEALSGGRDFSESQFNRATQALRQPGSAFKPFLYGAALLKGFTPATLLYDAPRRYPKQETTWDPRNYNGIYMGSVTLRTALAHSLNAASLDLAGKSGTADAIAFAHRMGLKSPIEDSFAAILGASEVSLLELVDAYAPFANGGFHIEARLIEGVFDAQGETLELADYDREPVLEPAQSFLMTSLLRSVVTEGTASSLPQLGFSRPAAGKTGTTNDGRDAWFIGYTTRLLAGVWVGDDQHRSLKATGASRALPLWALYMKEAAQDQPEEDFVQPEGLVSARIDPASGLLARSGCPEKRDELFVKGTEPTQFCTLHAGGVKGWFKRLFGR